MDQQPQDTLQKALIHLDEAWSHLLRRITADIKEYPYSIPSSQVYLLRLLDRLGPQRMSQLAAHLGISQGSCTPQVDRAVAAGLVERRRDPSDRRVVQVTISAKGQEALEELRTIRAQILARYMSVLPEHEIETLAALIDRVATAIHQDEAFSNQTSEVQTKS